MRDREKERCTSSAEKRVAVMDEGREGCQVCVGVDEVGRVVAVGKEEPGSGDNEEAGAQEREKETSGRNYVPTDEVNKRQSFEK